MAAFVDVLLRGIRLSSEAVAVGGVLFIIVVVLPPSLKSGEFPGLLGRSLKLIMAGACSVAVTQWLSLVVQLGSLADEHGWPVREAFATTYVRASVVHILASVGLAVGSWVIHRGRAGARSWAALIGFTTVLGASSGWMSHAVGRLENRALLVALDTLHQLGAGVWVGGLIHLMAVASRQGGRPWPVAVFRRFSAMALVAVATLVTAGGGLSLYYVDGIDALVGTTYGVMVLAKAVLLSGLLALGGMNFLAVRRLSREAEAAPPQLWRFVEAEVGLGITVLFVAASLTSLPPAVDLGVTDRATLSEVAATFTPQWPRFSSPSIEELPIDDPLAPRGAEDIAWSEYNHHVAGLFVLAMGLLAVLERTRLARRARHWPLLFLGLAGFLFVRDDPDAWPLGPMGFWEGMLVSTVVQHRVFVLLTVAFGLFEWMVRTGQLRSPRWALVFPLVAAIGGGFLFAHSHDLANLKASFLVEVSHILLGLLGIFIGWTRWLELRLSPPGNRALAWFWRLGLVLVGSVLLLYRES